ncbi:MAG: DMT family transporter [Bdellovibrionales bacterium]
MSKPVSHLRAILYAIAGFTCWVIGDTMLKLIGPDHSPAYQILSFGSFGGMAVIFIVTAARGRLQKLRPRRFTGLFIFGLLYLFGYFCWLTALPRLPLANFYVIIFLAPVIITLLAAIFLKERLSWKHAATIVVGFIGVLISINPQRLLADHNGWLGYGAAFGGTLTFALQMLVLRMLAGKETRECAAFYPRLVAIAGCALAAIIGGLEPMRTKEIVFALASGGIGGVGWLFMASAYKSTPATTVAPFHYSQIISASLLGYIFWGDVPTPRLLLGAAIIIAAGFYLVTHVKKSAVLLKEETHT